MTKNKVVLEISLELIPASQVMSSQVMSSQVFVYSDHLWHKSRGVYRIIRKKSLNK